MAILLRGIDRQETIDQTMAIVRSGEQLDLSDVAAFVVDKHSTGGVGDKTTFVAAPLAAAAGVRAAKLLGRGLGLPAAPSTSWNRYLAFARNLTPTEFYGQLQSIGLVVSGQSPELAPAGGRLFALRDVTATVSSPPLIASSIMSVNSPLGPTALCWMSRWAVALSLRPKRTPSVSPHRWLLSGMKWDAKLGP